MQMPGRLLHKRLALPAGTIPEMVRGMLKNGLDVSYCNIESSYGHDAFLLEDDTLGRLISNFLSNLETDKE